MTEIVNTYSLDDPYDMIPMDRREFYNEQLTIFLETWKPTKAVEVVNVFLFNEGGEIILQKRSSNKNHNPNLLDKAIGGHLVHGDEPDYTVMVETIQELQIPSLVLKSHEDFNKTFWLLKNYLWTIAIVEKIDTRLLQVTKIMNDKAVVIPNNTHIYVWVYGGSVKNVDHEAKGILFYSLEELEEELEKYPDIFTQDMYFYFKEYRDKLYKFRDTIVTL